MPLRIQKRKKIMPGVRVNIGKKGVSGVTLGKRGAGVTIGKRGTRANVGIPGTGISYSQKLSGGSQKAKDSSQNGEFSPLAGAITASIVAFVMSIFFLPTIFSIVLCLSMGALAYFLLGKLRNIPERDENETMD